MNEIFYQFNSFTQTVVDTLKDSRLCDCTKKGTDVSENELINYDCKRYYQKTNQHNRFKIIQVTLISLLTQVVLFVNQL